VRSEPDYKERNFESGNGADVGFSPMGIPRIANPHYWGLRNWKVELSPEEIFANRWETVLPQEMSSFGMSRPRSNSFRRRRDPELRNRKTGPILGSEHGSKRHLRCILGVSPFHFCSLWPGLQICIVPCCCGTGLWTTGSLVLHSVDELVQFFHSVSHRSSPMCVVP
jgi:hypothetical protein